jgi:dienelactone hydrolase
MSGWGIILFTNRAKMLAELGYTTLAADMYGHGRYLDNPKDAQESANVIYMNPDLLKARMTAAYRTLINSNRVVR